jgi:hypothetical protein
LLDASFRAYDRGLRRAYARLLDRAAETALDTYLVVVGGMRIGTVPYPGRDYAAWAEYVQANRDGLARLEEGQA